MMTTSTKSTLKETQRTTVSSAVLLAAPPNRSSHSARDRSSSQVVEGANGEVVIDDVRTPGQGDKAPLHTGRDIAGEITPPAGQGGTAGQRVVPCNIPRRIRATWNPLPACQSLGTHQAPRDDGEEPSRSPQCSQAHSACPGRGGPCAHIGRRYASCFTIDARSNPSFTTGRLLGPGARSPTWRSPQVT